MARTRGTKSTASETHVLNFFDYDDGCALTTILKNFRFHVVAGRKCLCFNDVNGQSILDQYEELIGAVRDRTEREEKHEKERQKGNIDVQGAYRPKGGQKSIAISNSLEKDNDSDVDITESPKKRFAAEGETDDVRVEFTRQNDQDPENDLAQWMLAPFSEGLGPSRTVKPRETECSKMVSETYILLQSGNPKLQISRNLRQNWRSEWRGEFQI
ncbi:uncharacterized protein BCR38DRAFT_412545 [Pseudomassariella vexata]|uniref:Uncharacterized protein n=1 Tax=Pseudomassariella vexata TaxID=1141098 RepID=A0A1Y2DJY9_9PEZI|nr:uncharacterized protein BCR38DRAFT_412545 [Pseudomassariella vexata]ORY59531.1 hypothetical protein BCR38DRAFT_412545 [Pseudomassariella vexata]